MGGKLVLYAAASLDGYLAESDGGIRFLDETPTSLSALGYEQFYETVGAIIMGGKTYRQVADELFPDKWPYAGKPCYVYSRTQSHRAEHVEFTTLPPASLLQKIRKEHEGDIWLMGGGETIRLFMRENLVDRYCIYLMPTLLGDGIPLFSTSFPKTNLVLESAKNIDAVIELIYSASVPAVFS